MPGFPFGKYFGEIRVLAALQQPDGARPYIDRPPAIPEPKDLLLYLGCNILRTAHLATTVIAVLKAMGFDFNAVGGPAYCCGIVHWLNGAQAASRGYSAGSLRHFAAFQPRHVLMWCPSCNEHYDEVVTQEHEVAFPYEHVTAFIARHLDRVSFRRRIERRVGLHYHTGHPQQDRDWASARTILRAIPGIEYVEVANPADLGRHCSPKYINRVGREGWRAHVRQVAASAEQAGVDVLGTIYHSCHREICGEQAGRPFEIVNYVTLLAQAMALDPPPDWFKRHKLAGDPAATFDEVREAAAALGLDATRVREVLDSSFAPACEAPTSTAPAD
jgi:hypothetical protein